MADNLTLNAGVGGATAAADDIGGVHHQRVKISVGADGAASDAIPVSNGLDTTAAGVQAAGIVGQFDDVATGTVTENQFAPVRISTRRALLVEGVASGTAVPVSSSTFATSAKQDTIIGHVDGIEALLTTIDTDTSNLSTQIDVLAGAVSGAEMQVDVITMPTVTVQDGGGSITVDNAQLSVVGSGTEAAAMRVTIATDSTGVLSIDDNGGNISIDDGGNTITVDGTVAVTNGGTFAVQVDGAALTALQLIDDAVQVLGTDTYTETTSKGLTIGAVRRDADTTLVNTTNEFGPLQMDANGRLKVEAFSGETLPVSGTVTANLAAGTNNIGDVDILTIAAGDNNIGNVDIVTMPNVTLAAGTNTNEVVGDIAHDTGVGGNPVLIAGAAQDMDDTAPPNRVSAESDTTRFATDRDGTQFVHPHGPQVWSYHVNGSSALTDTSVHAAPGASLSLYVTDIVVSSGAATAMNVFFEEGSTTVLGPYYLEAVAGRGLCIHFQTPKKITANTALTVTTSAAIAHAIDVTGFTAQG